MLYGYEMNKIVAWKLRINLLKQKWVRTGVLRKSAICKGVVATYIK